MQQTAMLSAFVLVALPLLSVSPAAGEQQSLAGTWGCQSVYGGPFTGRSCRTWPQLVIRQDGTYTWGSEKGTWAVQEGILHLSGRTGTGTLDADGKLIVEYESQGTQYRQVLVKR